MRTGIKILILAVTLAATLAVGTTGFQPAPASAADGGCYRPATTWNGWDVSSCSSDNGVHVFGDVYINKQGNAGFGCTLRYQIKDYDSGAVLSSTGPQGCYQGHHPAIQAQKVAGRRYVNVATLQVTFDGSGPRTWVIRSYITT